MKVLVAFIFATFVLAGRNATRGVPPRLFWLVVGSLVAAASFYSLRVV